MSRVNRTAREVMSTNPVTVPPGMSLLDVQHLLVVAGIGGVPVVEEGGAVVGIVNAGDVLRALEQALDDEEDAGESEDLRERLESLTAGEIATPEVVWVTPDTPAIEVAQRMHAEGIHRVLVGTDGQLEGILTAFDLLRAI